MAAFMLQQQSWIVWETLYEPENQKYLHYGSLQKRLTNLEVEFIGHL